MKVLKVPFAVVQGVCKYVGDTVGNRPITAVRDCLLCGRQFGILMFDLAPITTGRDRTIAWSDYYHTKLLECHKNAIKLNTLVFEFDKARFTIPE